jgi:hypothetical protein
MHNYNVLTVIAVRCSVDCVHIGIRNQRIDWPLILPFLLSAGADVTAEN